MKISVIVPFYNSAMYMDRCVSSLVKNEGDFEFLLINDQSTDGSEKVVECYSDPRIRLMDNEHAKGVSGARNTGLDHAKGKWVAFLDADDEMLPNAYEAFMRMAQEDANIIQAEHLRHYVNGNTVNKYSCEAGEYHLECLPDMWYMAWNKLYKREFLSDIRFMEGVQYGEDEVFNLDCLAKDNLLIHTKETTTLRHFNNAHSLSKSKGRAGLIKQARALEDFLMRCENPTARLTACKVLSDHWQSDVYRREFE